MDLKRSPLKSEISNELKVSGVKITSATGIESNIGTNEEKFAVMFLASPVAMSLATFPEGRLIDVNQAWLDLMGICERESVLGRTTVELGLIPDVGSRENIMNSFKQDGSVRNAEIIASTKNGTRINLLVNVKVVEIDGTKCLFSTNENITELKLAEEIIRKSQRTFSELVERAPFGIYVVDSKFRIAQMNLGSQTGAFKNVRPLIGRDFSDAMHILWPDSVAEGIIAEFRNTLNTGKPYFSPIFINSRNDIALIESYEWELHRIILPEGQYGVICYYFDSTKLRAAEAALRESEEKYRTIVETANEGIWIVNEAGKTDYVNYRMAKMLGYTIEEMMDNPWQLFIFETEISTSMARVELRKKGLSIKESYELTLRRKDGNPLFVLVHASPQYDSERRYQGSISLISDISELKLKEIELKENELKLRELINTKDKFFNIIAHDLKNPFTSMIGSSELLVENIDHLKCEKIRALAEIINDASKHGYGILLNLLDWSRSQTGMLKLNPERINLRKLIDEQIRNLGHISNNKEILVSSSVRNDIFITTDKNIINTILRNLISNAVKFSHRKGKVTISSAQKDQKYIISVKDNGIGIPPEKLEDIFMLDTKLSTPGTENEQGTGLGLRLCKELIERIEGEVWVESVEKKGSEFKFSIPYQKQ
jgi:PAS domain S-box-containing protein